MRRARKSALLALLVGGALLEPASGQSLAAPPESPARFGEVPPFEVVDSSGARVTREDLIGSPWIASCFLATHC